MAIDQRPNGTDVGFTTSVHEPTTLRGEQCVARTPAERYVKGGVNIDASDKRGVELCRPLPPPARHRARIRSSSACMPSRRFRPAMRTGRTGTPKDFFMHGTRDQHNPSRDAVGQLRKSPGTAEAR